MVKCAKCGRLWNVKHVFGETYPYEKELILSGSGCPECYPIKKHTNKHESPQQRSTETGEIDKCKEQR